MLRALIRVPSWKVRLGIDLGLRLSFTGVWGMPQIQTTPEKR